MSWSLFKTKMLALTGQQHTSVPQFAQTIADAYHTTMLLHFDATSAGGHIINSAPKYPILYQQILAQCNANLASQNEVHLLQQIAPFIQQYYVGLQIIGPTGSVTIVSPGVFTGIPVPQNFDFNIFVNAMVTAFRVHITTLTGIYTSSVVAGLVTPWSGISLQSTP